MKQFDLFIEKRWKYIVLALLVATFLNTCGNPNRQTNKKIVLLTNQIDSLRESAITRRDLLIEGLKTEKRLIQSTDRSLLDVQRQSAIDREIIALEK